DQAEKNTQEQAFAEAEGALVALGYKPQEASKMLMKVADQCSTPEEMIRIALRNTMGGK
ncbi:MAG TPA: Holliday junction branch migration protein RuvA, partial [Oceanospirillales bacterium]|nr:Holliday junction branch migration protein RuvA [Oceanospirillales bacterium]